MSKRFNIPGGVLAAFFFLICGLWIAARHAGAADWDPFKDLERPSGIPDPPAARQERDGNSWPVETAGAAEWRETSDGYEVSIPLRLPDDADRKQVTARYSNGSVKVVASKKKAHWDVREYNRSQVPGNAYMQGF